MPRLCKPHSHPSSSTRRSQIVANNSQGNFGHRFIATTAALLLFGFGEQNVLSATRVVEGEMNGKTFHAEVLRHGERGRRFHVDGTEPQLPPLINLMSSFREQGGRRVHPGDVNTKSF